MSTFQYLVWAFLSSLSSIIPVPASWVRDFSDRILQWGAPSSELITLVACTASLYLVYFFRYDFLGFISATIRSIVKPASLAPANRSLDQHTLLFILIIFPFVILSVMQIHPALAEIDFLNHPFARAVCFSLVAFGFQFSKNWNKRIKGLNHLKLSDAFVIGVLSMLPAFDSIPWIAILWIGMALHNYHFESIFKYSFILVTLELVAVTLSRLQTNGFVSSLQSVGILNSIAVIVVSLTTIYMTMDHLQRTMSESTYSNSRNWCILAAIFYVVLGFL